MSKSIARKRWESARRSIAILEKARDADLKRHGGRSSGDTLEVDYFALGHVLEYVNNAMDDIETLIDVRERISFIGDQSS